MIALPSLKQDLEFSNNLSEIIDVLKVSALIQFRSFQLKEKPNKNFLRQLDLDLSLLIDSGIKHPYLSGRQSLPTAIVVVASDEGFAGELNTLLVNAGVDLRKNIGDEIIILGERGARYLEEMKVGFLFFPGISAEVEFKEAEVIRDYLLKNYRRKFGRIVVVYPEFVSLTIQRTTVLQLLPYSSKDSSIAGKVNLKRVEGLLREPSPERILDGLVWLWMGFKLWEIFWSAKQSEYAARIMHLEGSTQELSQVKQVLSFQYSRQMHALSDKTIREISAAKILLEKK